jgi:hypothetical protein
MHQESSPPNGPLQRFLGSWRGEVSVHAVGVEPQHYTQENSWAWALGGVFLEERGTGSNGSSFIGLWAVDPSGKYRAHYFLAPSGDVVTLTHEWSEHDQTFTGSAELGGGVRISADDRFVDRDRYEWNITIQDGSGNVLTRMHGRERRIGA